MGAAFGSPPTPLSEWSELAANESGDLRIAVAGEDPIANVVCALTRIALEALGEPTEVVRVNSPIGKFESCVNGLVERGFKGVHVVNPLKVAAARLGERFYMSEHSMGVANTLLLQGERVYAKNTESIAYAKRLESLEPGVALVLGAGQGARSVSVSLLTAGWKVRVWNQGRMKSSVLVPLLSRYGDIELIPHPNPSGCSLIINATPLGAKAGEMPPLDWVNIRRGTLVFDRMFRNVATDFVREARNRGLRAIDGRELFAEQMALALEWWLDKPVPLAPVRLALGMRN